MSNTNLLVPSRQFGHEHAMRRNGLPLLSVETNETTFPGADVLCNAGNNRLSVPTDSDCFRTTVHLPPTMDQKLYTLATYQHTHTHTSDGQMISNRE